MDTINLSKFSKVSGVCNKFLKDEIRETPTLLLPQITQKFTPFLSSNLLNVFYKEVNLYLDKALYQYIIARKLMAKGNFSWGAVTQYYASFFAISGLLRLNEAAFVRIDISDYEVSKTDDGNIYNIRTARTKGLHRIVWKTFYSLYKDFSCEDTIFSYVVNPYKGEIYYDTNRRNDINYAPGKGYDEIYKTTTIVNRFKKERLNDRYASTSFYDDNDWVNSDVLTQHRIRLLANLICKIDKDSIFPAQVKDRISDRKNLIQKYEEDLKYRKRYNSWIDGE